MTTQEAYLFEEIIKALKSISCRVNSTMQTRDSDDLVSEAEAIREAERLLALAPLED